MSNRVREFARQNLKEAERQGCRFNDATRSEILACDALVIDYLPVKLKARFKNMMRDNLVDSIDIKATGLAIKTLVREGQHPTLLGRILGTNIGMVQYGVEMYLDPMSKVS